MNNRKECKSKNKTNGMGKSRLNLYFQLFDYEIKIFKFILFSYKDRGSNQERLCFVSISFGYF
ncbi:unnamed protein product [Meloidogyne enterolobii]|uniref:Uncharacterized protein n=1 Tax=Meloidogyne enterolobii TaxID=390850 RepID=A0ACB1ATN8_MELEN